MTNGTKIEYHGKKYHFYLQFVAQSSTTCAIHSIDITRFYLARCSFTLYLFVPFVQFNVTQNTI